MIAHMANGTEYGYAAALLYYDYVLTFRSEFNYLWRGGILKVSTLLYALCRYALVANVLYLLAISNHLGDAARVRPVSSPSYPFLTTAFFSEPACNDMS